MAQAALFLRYWPRFVAACHRRYGDVFTLRLSSLGTVVYLADPADIKEVFAGDPRVFHAGEANSMLSGLLGDSSVLVIDDEVHANRRRLMLAPFTRRAVDRQTAAMADITAASIAEWPVGTSFAVAPRMSVITMEVILRTVIGASDPDRLARLRAVLSPLLSLNTFDSLSIAEAGLQQRRPWHRVRDRIADADTLLYAEIAERRRDPALADRTDALAMLIRTGEGMSDRELRDQLMTLLLAGHDTTATGLSWALERLTRHPEILRRAVQAAEASAAGDPAGDDYLDAVAKETLRVRPVVFDVGRVLTEPADIAGYRLPRGVMVAPGIGLVHSSAAQYRDPDRFDPDRMLGVTPGTWLPFGGGNRRCLGATFAMTEMRVVLREVLRRVELDTTTEAGERQRVKHVILVPHRGGRIRARAIRQVPVAGAAGGGSAGCPAHPA
ncbi:cytochrome P450 [Mycobacterium sp. BMJ-28]